MKRKKNGFAATGVLYTILVIFLILMSTLLLALSSRSRILNKLKSEAIGYKSSIKEYDVYKNGKAVYFNPVTGLSCDINDAVSTTTTKTGCMKWYAFNDNANSSTVNLILDHNTTALVAWNSSGKNADEMNEVKTELDKLVSVSKWIVTPRLITADEVAKITENSTFDSKSSTYDQYFYFDNNKTSQEVSGLGTSKYAWLYDYTQTCTLYGCNIDDDSNKGYWTSTPVYGRSNAAWSVWLDGELKYGDVNDKTRYGIRPVITVSKDKLDPNAPDHKTMKIPSSNYNVGSKVSYLGYNWYVMKDNGDNDLLIMDGYLSNDELKANLPSNVDSSIISSYGMKLCLGGSESGISETDFLNKAGNYCYGYWKSSNNNFRNYTWKTSFAKPTLENWLNKKMAENNLLIDKELKGMSFTDGKENNAGYVRLIQSSEFSLDKTSTSGACPYGSYCPINEEYAIRTYAYWTMTLTSSNGSMVFINTNNENYTSFGTFPFDSTARIVPVINVNEK